MRRKRKESNPVTAENHQTTMINNKIKRKEKKIYKKTGKQQNSGCKSSLISNNLDCKQTKFPTEMIQTSQMNLKKRDPTIYCLKETHFT